MYWTSSLQNYSSTYERANTIKLVSDIITLRKTSNSGKQLLYKWKIYIAGPYRDSVIKTKAEDCSAHLRNGPSIPPNKIYFK